MRQRATGSLQEEFEQAKLFAGQRDFDALFQQPVRNRVQFATAEQGREEAPLLRREPHSVEA